MQAPSRLPFPAAKTECMHQTLWAPNKRQQGRHYRYPLQAEKGVSWGFCAAPFLMIWLHPIGRHSGSQCHACMCASAFVTGSPAGARHHAAGASQIESTCPSPGSGCRACMQGNLSVIEFCMLIHPPASTPANNLHAREVLRGQKDGLCAILKGVEPLWR